MVLVYERVAQSQDMMFVMRITLVVKLEKLKSALKLSSNNSAETYQLKNCHLHHTLVEVCRFVFHDLHSHNFVVLHILALYNLPKRALSQDIQNQVSDRVHKSDNSAVRLITKK